MTLEEAKKEILEMSMGAIGERGMNPSKEGISYDGLIRTYDDILAILAKVDTEPALKDKMTLTELAHELRKLFKFRWLTACKKMTGGSPVGLDLFTGSRPEYTDDGYWANNYVVAGGSLVIPVALLSMYLDLSEYKDENGEIDYSKCIVEV